MHDSIRMEEVVERVEIAGIARRQPANDERASWIGHVRSFAHSRNGHLDGVREDANGDGRADVIDTLTMHPHAGREVVRLLAGLSTG